MGFKKKSSLKQVPKKDIIYIKCDFNIKVGSQAETAIINSFGLEQG